MVRVGDIVRDPALLRVGMRIEAQSPLRGAFRCVLTKWERGDDGHFYMAARREDGFAYDTIMPESIVMAGVEILALPDGEAVMPSADGAAVGKMRGVEEAVVTPPRCATGCTPVAPCRIRAGEYVCPALEEVLLWNGLAWSSEEEALSMCANDARELVWGAPQRPRLMRAPEPSRSGLGALACPLHHVKPPR